MDKLLKLQTPSEQSRLLNEIPEVIADIIELQPDCVDSTRIDGKENIGTSPESGHQRTYTSPAQNLKSNGVSCHLNDSTDTAGCHSPAFSYKKSILVYLNDCKVL